MVHHLRKFNPRILWNIPHATKHMAASMATSGKALMTFDATFVIHGYHVYKDIWTAVIGEWRNCEREFGNHHDPFAVTIMKDG